MKAFPQTVAVIPARYASTRFPGKPLAILAGKPMIQWTYERTASSRVARVLVATDDERIADCVRNFGGEAVMTRGDHPSGTDRIAEALDQVGSDAQIVLNVQGDEPTVPPAVLNELLAAMLAAPEVEMGTVAVPIAPDREAFADPNVVKVVCDRQGFALYFSRSAIPFGRDGGTRDAHSQPCRHWGLYAYRRDFLARFVQWPRGSLEGCEMLEQLRALENGARIRVLRADAESIGVDVPADLPKAEDRLRELLVEERTNE